MRMRTLRMVLCGFAIATTGFQLIQAADNKAPDNKASGIKGGISGKIAKVDLDKGSVTIIGDNDRERTFSITDETVIVGPRGGIVRKRLKDPRFHQGLAITVVANGSTATQLHLGYDRKARQGTRTSSSIGSPSATAPSGSGSAEDSGSGKTTRTTRTSRFRGLPATKADSARSAGNEEQEDEDSDFVGKVKSVDPSKRILVITLLNGSTRSFLLAHDVKVSVNGRASRHGLSDPALKPGIPITVLTEAGGRKVKEVKALSTAARRMKKAS